MVVAAMARSFSTWVALALALAYCAGGRGHQLGATQQANCALGCGSAEGSLAQQQHQQPCAAHGTADAAAVCNCGKPARCAPAHDDDADTSPAPASSGAVMPAAAAIPASKLSSSSGHSTAVGGGVDGGVASGVSRLPASLVGMGPAPRRRWLVQSTPAGTTVTNGSYSVAFPSAFTSWCLTDNACLLQATITVTLDYYDAVVYTSNTTNWPASAVPSAAVKAGSVLAMSDVVDFQLNYKQDSSICGDTATCTATLSLLLYSTYDSTKNFLCVRLVPGATAYTASGYPNTLNGTTVYPTILKGILRCNVTQLGKFVIVQYDINSPPPLSSPPPTLAAKSYPPPPPAFAPPPPPFEGTVGVTVFRFTVWFGDPVNFDTFVSDQPLYQAFLADVTSHLLQNLAVAMPALLLDSSTGLPAYSLLTVDKVWRGSPSGVKVDFRITTPGGTTTAQLASLRALVAQNTVALFAGSSYAAEVQPGIGVPVDVPVRTMPRVLLVIICACSFIVIVLVVVLLYVIWLLWRVWPILPKEIDANPNAWDPAINAKAATRQQYGSGQSSPASTPPSKRKSGRDSLLGPRSVPSVSYERPSANAQADPW